MTTNHTPGPWAIETDHDEDIEDTVLIHGAADHPGLVPIALVYTAEAFPCTEDEDRAALQAETNANARLIAAAPDLLLACEAASHTLRSYQYGNAATDLAKEIADSIDSVIRHARGDT